MKLNVAFLIATVGTVALVYRRHHTNTNSDNHYPTASEFESAMANRETTPRGLKTRPVRFYAMGDAPYSQTEKDNLPLQLALLDPTVDFTVHLGDMQDRTPLCKPAPYKELAAVLKKSPTPTFIIPGDNCYYDCANWQQGFEYWKESLLGLEKNWVTNFNVRKQAVRPENFSITMQRVLFIGIHTLWVRAIKSEAHWLQLEQDDINWTRNQLKGFAHSGLVDAVVILGHAYPRKELYTKYFDYISDEAESLPNMPFLFLQGDAHRFVQDTPFRAKNILRTVVDRGGIADPVLVTIDPSQDNPFLFQRRPLTGK